MDQLVGLFGQGSNDRTTLSDALPPEIEEGNVEYKLKLVKPTPSRLEHLVTQMKWRLQEGQGEAIYQIGVEDCGLLAGLTDDEMKASLETLNTMASKLGATLSILRERQVDTTSGVPEKRVAEVLVRLVPESQQFIDLRLAVLGNVDAGKSTILGVLTHGELDNGRGRARLNLFRHLHEIQSGRTSSISHEILGFNAKGEVFNYSESRTVEEICENSTKLISFIDLCGHHKYLKTTIFGLTGYSPDFAMLVVSATTGIVGTTKEHLGFALALGVPTFVVVTKIDACRTAQTERTLHQLERTLKGPGCRRIPIRVETVDDACTAASNFHSERICPIFAISCVSGCNLNLLLRFLNVLPPLNNSSDHAKVVQDLTELQIDEVYSIAGVGTVVGGTLRTGTVKEGDELLLGPSDDGRFFPVCVSSLHRNRLPCRVALAGQAACIAIGKTDPCPVRKGMVLVSPHMQPTSCFEFEADIYVLYHNKFICRGFQTVVHVGNVRQTAIIVKMSKGGIQTNEKAVVTFRFIKRPEYIRLGSRLLFREGRTKGMGEVTKVIALMPEAVPCR
jgi:GTPase